MGIVWEEPAEAANGVAGKWHAVAAELRANPGAWALMATDVAASCAYNWRKGKNSAFSTVGEWEFTTRDVVSGKGKIYGRYIGA